MNTLLVWRVAVTVLALVATTMNVALLGPLLRHRPAGPFTVTWVLYVAVACAWALTAVYGRLSEANGNAPLNWRDVAVAVPLSLSVAAATAGWRALGRHIGYQEVYPDA